MMADASLAQSEAWTQNPIQTAMFRVLNFDAIYDGYVAAQPTPERFLDTLIRLEREIFAIDQPAPKGHRKAQVQVDDPINLKDYWDDYQKNRFSTINMITYKLQQTVQQNLDQLNQLTT